jgi:YVTN family beta-propeller protein
MQTPDNVVRAVVPVGRSAIGILVTPDGEFVYVARSEDNSVSVIQGAENVVAGTIAPAGC